MITQNIILDQNNDHLANWDINIIANNIISASYLKFKESTISDFV